jgi:hypothetical protein
MSAGRRTLPVNQRVEMLARLRDARALALRDAESFHEASTVLEYIGQVIAGEIRLGLGRYQGEILALAAEAERFNGDEVKRLFRAVREARNMAVHDGAWARHLNSRLVDLFLILEEAIMSNMQFVEDLMVRTPVIAEPWHLVSHVRRTMLANSFSNIPVCVESQGARRWKILTDTAIMQWIRAATSKSDKMRRLSLPIGEALAQGAIATEDAAHCKPGDLIAKVVPQMNHLPTLVIEGINGQERLVGIIMPFDVL